MAGFSLAFGAMFSKTWRVHSIFTDVKLNKKVSNILFLSTNTPLKSLIFTNLLISFYFWYFRQNSICHQGSKAMSCGSHYGRHIELWVKWGVQATQGEDKLYPSGAYSTFHICETKKAGSINFLITYINQVNIILMLDTLPCYIGIELIWAFLLSVSHEFPHEFNVSKSFYSSIS